MNLPLLDRRMLMRGVSVAGCLGLVGLRSGAVGAAEPSPAEPLAGALIGWLMVVPDGRGELSIVQTDAQSRPVRLVWSEAIPAMSSIQGTARRASEALVRLVAQSWGVSPDECTCGRGEVQHRPSQRTIAYAIWTDFV